LRLEREKKKKDMQLKEQAKLLEIEAKINKARERIKAAKS
jgi:hypothetical protein